MTMPPSAEALLKKLVEIEDREIAAARVGGCKCSKPYPGTDRDYPCISFDRDKSVGKPLNEIVWYMNHEEGCPMDGQEGIG